MNFKYIFGVLISTPLLPILYVQAKKIRKKVPKLPEAKHPKGTYKATSNKVINIVALGESTFAGVGVQEHKDGFIGALAEELSIQNKLSVNWSVYAKSGFTTTMIHNKILPKVKEDNIDIILIGVGGNDAFTLNNPYQWKKDICKLLASLQVKFPNSIIYFTNMPPIKEFPAFTKTIKFVIGNLVEILGSELKKIRKNYKNVYYNDEVIKLSAWKKRYKIEGDAGTFFSDGVHPSEITYRTWGKDMATFISNSKQFKKWMQKQL